VNQDWRGVAEYLEERGGNGDIVIAYTLNYAQAFNNAHTALPYYLSKSDVRFRLLRANSLTPKALDLLQGDEVTVWSVVMVWGPQVTFPGWEAEISYWPTHIYIVKEVEQEGSTLERVIENYEHVLSLAYEPSPKCALEKDLALLYIAAGEGEAAGEALKRSEERCPELPERALPWTREWAREQLARGLGDGE
jgi:hypothetical protein